VRIQYATIRRMLSRAVFDGVVRDNAARSVWKELPVSKAAKATGRRRSKDQVKAMGEEQLHTFLAQAVEDARHFVLFMTFAKAGLRMGEALGLHLVDPDTVTKELQVRRTLAAAERDGMGIEDRLGTPKSGEARSVEIGPTLADALAHHITQRRAQNLERGWDEERSPWLFVTEEGTPLDESRVRKAFARILKAAKLPARFTPHALRHTYASLMLAKGAPLPWVSAQLGHSSPQVTLDWYGWALPTGEKSHAARLDAPDEARAPLAKVVRERADNRHRARVVTSGDQNSTTDRSDVSKSLTGWSRCSGLNRGPADYESAALPLSYIGDWQDPDRIKRLVRRQRPARIEARAAPGRTRPD
jgi:integrase